MIPKLPILLAQLIFFTDKLDLRGNKTIALAHLSIYYTWKNVTSEYKNNKFKITDLLGMKLLIYLMVATQLLIFKTIYCTSLKNTKLLQQMKNHQC